MSYAKSVFFIPVWFDEYDTFAKEMAGDHRWAPINVEKLWATHLFRYACNINRPEKNLLSSFTLKDLSSLNVYTFEEEVGWAEPPTIEEVRLSCFATGVGFMEFWVSYSNNTPDEIATFSYYFKKATRMDTKELLGDRRPLYDVALDLLPKKPAAKLFFASATRIKYECNCYHFLHLDQPAPDEDTRNATLYRLCRSYRPNMPVPLDSSYDMVYQASDGDYWSGCTEGFANIVYDDPNHYDEYTDYFFHSIKPKAMNNNYYFMYLLLLNQKYSAVKYIELVADAPSNSSFKQTEALNKRIVQLKNSFSFNVISDDSIVQNLYAKMYGILEIRSFLEDIIENEQQMELLLEAKQRESERRSGRFLMALTIFSLFSIFLDTAGLFDRFGIQNNNSTVISLILIPILILLYIGGLYFQNRKR